MLIARHAIARRAKSNNGEESIKTKRRIYAQKKRQTKSPLTHSCTVKNTPLSMWHRAEIPLFRRFTDGYKRIMEARFHQNTENSPPQQNIGGYMDISTVS